MVGLHESDETPSRLTNWLWSALQIMETNLCLSQRLLPNISLGNKVSMFRRPCHVLHVARTKFSALKACEWLARWAYPRYKLSVWAFIVLFLCVYAFLRSSSFSTTIIHVTRMSLESLGSRNNFWSSMLNWHPVSKAAFPRNCQAYVGSSIYATILVWLFVEHLR